MRFRDLAQVRDRLGPAAAMRAAEALNHPGPARRSKYRNVPVTVDDERFDSKHEQRTCAKLRHAYGKENIVRQVSFPLTDGKRIRPDFMIVHDIYDDGTFRAELVDAKGQATKEWEAKASHLKTLYGLKIRIISK